jgi:hypothetical protein
MNRHLILTLSNPLNSNETLDLKIEVNDTDISRHWFSHVCNCLDAGLHLEKNFCWLGWPDPDRNVEYLKGQLQLCVDKINEFAATSNEWNGYRIEEEWDDIGSHDALNKLHHHFEILMGQVWDVSHYMITANDDTKYQIRQLNNLVHELQSRQGADAVPVEHLYPHTIVSYLNVERELFEDSYFDYFSHKREFGEVYLHYSQTGKTPVEAYSDNDDDVFDNNINALRYVSGEYNIWWGEPMSDSEVLRFKDQVRSYLNDRNLIVSEGPDFNYYVDSQGNKQGIGYVPVAKVVNPYNSNQELKKHILEKLNIHALTAYLDDNQVAKHVWDYSWADSDYQEKEIETLRDHFPR